MTDLLLFFPLFVISYGTMPLIKTLFKVTEKSSEAVCLFMLCCELDIEIQVLLLFKRARNM